MGIVQPILAFGLSYFIGGMPAAVAAAAASPVLAALPLLIPSQAIAAGSAGVGRSRSRLALLTILNQILVMLPLIAYEGLTFIRFFSMAP